MCTTCGCSTDAKLTMTHFINGGASAGLRGQRFEPLPGSRSIPLELDLLEKNKAIASQNRKLFQDRGILALNLMSSPGAGKTTLLERTIRDLRDTLPLSVVEGDQETANDAERIRQAGGRAIQINTGAGCHLDADMIRRALGELKPEPGSMVLIENVGNLVCPALFDLGESAKVVIFSVTEGDDKPLKYPHMFRASDLVLINKIDLLPHVRFDLERSKAAARQVNPHLEFIELSAERGDGLETWYEWLNRAQRERKAERAA